MRVQRYPDRIVYQFDPIEDEGLEADVAAMAAWLGSTLDALVELRTRPAGEAPQRGVAYWAGVIAQLDQELLPRLEGVRRAVVREHAQAGGSVRQLATASAAPSSTVQYQREQILRDPPSRMERWATGRPSTCVYELRQTAEAWEAVRDGKVFGSWDREADPDNLREQMAPVFIEQYGRTPRWIPIDQGFRAE
ncbi:hypothetical protein AB0M43_38245 [Longispora sp. NPDC051575]|uniref:hypothetical protein n=1 Tax=Longispora sp. NPDC051575 TaxID=3154943 RepID=UPI003442392C